MRPPRLVALTYNLKRDDSDRDAEWDTPDTIGAVRRAIARRWTCIPIEANERAYERLRRARPDIIFNVAEGWGGPAREGHFPSLFEVLGLPYTGSDPTTLNICLHKARTKDVLIAQGIATPRYGIDEGPLPAVVKPLHEGSSKGVRDTSLARSRPALEREIRRIRRLYRQPAIVEAYLPGREFTVALLGNPPKILPIVEIRFDTLPRGTNPIYSYEAKWIWDTSDRPLEIFECPARLTLPLQRGIEDVCLRAWRALDIRDWARMDVRLDAAGRPNILEVNPLPGILPKPEDNSCFPKAARVAGMTYEQLVQRVVEIAWERIHAHRLTR
ncbi:MAG: D-alanine--D-alanine ligase [Planctomycetes bacterium]|nr:D-alanine--D-alanine ligase [Planctomycetota bacterium]